MEINNATVVGDLTVDNETIASLNEVKTYENLLINANFDYWQRSEGPVTQDSAIPDYKAPDRWLTRRQGTGDFTVEKSVYAAGLGNYLLAKTIDTNGCYINVLQRIESRYIQPFVGETLYFGVWGYHDVGSTLEISMNAYTPNSTPDTWSTDFLDLNYIGGTDTNVANETWTWLEYSFTVPADGINGLMVQFQTDVINPTAKSVYLKNAVLYKGSERVSDDLIHRRHPEQELALCQRYYEKSVDIEDSPFNVSAGYTYLVNAGGSTVRLIALNGGVFKVRKRSTPTVRVWGSQGNQNEVTAYNGVTEFTVSGISGESQHTPFTYLSMTDTIVAGTTYKCHWDADSEI